ncbi:peroxiredoxin family protein [Paenibacillus allorhizosphaerae]|uniref:Peroxiredoxin n=1 Tax=Paenibacillus allorhizosphaerae TaxID=2849866 RepID=A0ABM8VG64_9BACL|nr:peroxiredoxin family protein [Paenibacillus allorhizosphaerae]CAG7637209.1 Putative peroxiredoxin [Paenibacillus allorhizosphaerae]
MRVSLTTGDAAPDFTFTGIDGTPVRLSDLRGRKVLIAFFRNAACALCNLRVRHFIRRYDEWQRQGLEIVAVFESPQSSISRHVGRQEAPFPLAADAGADLYERYGVEVSAEKVQATIADANTKTFISEAEAEGFALTPEEGANMHRIPAEFLIDENGIVQVAHYGRLVTDHLPLDAIDRFAASGHSESAD